MANTPSPYPSVVATYTVKVNHIDVYNDDHINKLQNDVIALQTYVGTNPQGTKNDFATRVNVILNGSGVVVNSTGFPADTTPMRLWYRTDLETLYIRRFANDAWQAIGGAPSNTVFCWSGIDDRSNDTNTGYGIYIGAASTPAITGTNNLYYLVGQTAATYTLISTKFSKVAGISTIKLYSKIWSLSLSVSAIVNINSGGVTGTTGVVTSTVPTWANSGGIDVSGLTNGTTYDLSIRLSNNNNGIGPAYMSSVIVFGA